MNVQPSDEGSPANKVIVIEHLKCIILLSFMVALKFKLILLS